MKPSHVVFYLIPALVLALAVATALLVVRERQSNQGQNDAIRTVICLFETRTLQSPQLTDAQKQASVAIYTQALAAIGETAC